MSEDDDEVIALRRLAEEHERDLKALQERLDTISKELEGYKKPAKSSKKERFSLEASNFAKKTTILFILFLVLSSASLAFFSARIGELLSLVSFAFIVFAAFAEFAKIIVDRSNSINDTYD